MEKLARSSLKGVSNRALSAYENGRFVASTFLLLGKGFLEASKKANLSFKSPSPKPHLNRVSFFALPNFTEQASGVYAQRKLPQKSREETKGRFRKRVVLANVPSFRVFGTGEHPHVPSFRFFGAREHPNVPSFRFWYRGTSAKTALLVSGQRKTAQKIQWKIRLFVAF